MGRYFLEVVIFWVELVERRNKTNDPECSLQKKLSASQTFTNTNIGTEDQPKNLKDTPKSQPNEQSDNEDDCMYVGATHYISLLSDDEETEIQPTILLMKIPNSLLKDEVSDHEDIDVHSSTSETILSTNNKGDCDEGHPVTVIENSLTTEIEISDDDSDEDQDEDDDDDNNKDEKNFIEDTADHFEDQKENGEEQKEGLTKVVHSIEIEKLPQETSPSPDMVDIETIDNEDKPKSQNTLVTTVPKVLWSQAMPSITLSSIKIQKDDSDQSQLLMAELFGNDDVIEDSTRQIPDDISISGSESSDSSSSKNTKNNNSENTSDNSSDSSSSNSSDCEKSGEEKKASSDSDTESGEVSDEDENNENENKDLEIEGREITGPNEKPEVKKAKIEC